MKRIGIWTLPASVLLAIMLLGAQCSTPPQTQPSLPTTRMTIGSKQFEIEIADSDPAREHGLMDRDTMPADHGMIFVFPDEQVLHFWMKNTRIGLDIAFVDANGTVVSVKQMKPYDLRTTSSDAPAKYAIELNENAATTAGIKTGDRIEIPSFAKTAKN